MQRAHFERLPALRTSSKGPHMAAVRATGPLGLGGAKLTTKSLKDGRSEGFSVSIRPIRSASSAH